MDMTTGKVIRFDEVKGYGFVAPADGGEDVFIHANEINDRGLRVSVGTLLEFRVMDGSRGLKAYDVRIIEERPQAPAPAVQAVQAVVPVSPAEPNGSHPAAPVAAAQPTADEDLFEVFSEREFTQQITDLLLSSAPQLTGSTVVELRGDLLRFAQKNGWVE
jgi:cold shock protein